MNNLQFYL